MRGFLERIEREPSPGVGDGLMEAAPGDESLHQAPQYRSQLPLQGAPLLALPVVEWRAVAQSKALQKGAGEQRCRIAQRFPGRAVGRELAKALDVELEAASPTQGDGVSCRIDPLLADGGP